MKKKIIILGSTGSIGKNLINIIGKNKNDFEVVLLSAQNNHIELLKQAKKFNVKNLIITNKKKYQMLLKKVKNKKINIYNDFSKLNLIIKKKVDYSMVSISGIDGLYPSLKLIKYTKVIALANKESIICGWKLINKALLKYRVKFIPVDSEHFSIWFSSNNINNSNIDKIYLTASGGPFLNYTKKKLIKVKISDTLNHPNWRMGKKISVDSATLMNKIFEIIEAKNIFNLEYKKLSIIIHKQSFIHSIIKYKNGMIKFIAHDTTMKIPIFNSLYNQKIKSLKTNNLRIHDLNNLDFDKIDLKLFPINKILNFLPNKSSLFETILVTANDRFVDLYLKKKIKFINFHEILFNFIKQDEFKKYKTKKVENVEDILNLSKYVRLKIDKIYI